MSKIKDYCLDNPLEVISGADEQKENPFACSYCDDRGYVEISGDDGYGNWDVVDEQPCVCQEGKYTKVVKEFFGANLGTPIRQWEVEDQINNPNPLG